MIREPATQPPLDCWRGSWSQAVAAMRAARESPEGLHALIQQTIEGTDLQTARSRLRVKQVLALGQLIEQDPDSARPEAEAHRADITGMRVLHQTEALSVLREALEDPVLRDHQLTRAQLAQVRAITLEDLERVYDLGCMPERAQHLAYFMLGQARETGRFDDLRFALRFGNLYSERHTEDAHGVAVLGLLMLDTLLHVPAVSRPDAEDRMRSIEAARSFFEVASMNQTESISGLLREAAGATADTLPLAEHVPAYQEGFDRLRDAYAVTGNATYLYELVLLCNGPPSGNAHEHAKRLNDAAVILGDRGRAYARPSDLREALVLLDQALSLVDADDSLKALLRANVAAFRLGLALLSGESISPELLERLRGLLPQVPWDPAFGSGESVSRAYLTRAQMELLVALETPLADAASVFLDNVAAAAEAAYQAHPRQGPASIVPLLASGQLLRAAREQEPVDERDAEIVAAVIADPHSFPEAFGWTIGVVGQLIESCPEVRPRLRRALWTAITVSEPHAGEQLARTFNLSLVLARLMALDVDVKDEAQRGDVILIAMRALTAAANVALYEPQRGLGLRGLRWAADTTRLIALQFVSVGKPDVAALLCESSAAVMAGMTVRQTRSVRDVQQLVSAQLTTPARCASLVALTDGEEIAILTREPGAEWMLASRRPADELAPFTSFAWLHGEGGRRLLALRTWVTELAPVLAELLGDALLALQARTDEPVLCLPTGPLMALPLALIGWVRPEIYLPFVIVPGPLCDGVVELVTAPTPRMPCVALLLGAAQLPETGILDIAADAEVIGGAGVTVDELRSASEPEFTTRLSGADAIHFSGHLSPVGPDDTELRFADGTALMLTEVRTLRLDVTRVVALVSCYSAFWPTHAAEQVEHAAGAFLEAGAGAVVATLWPALDQPSHLFTRAFYIDLASGASIADAFRAGVDAIRSFRIGALRPYEHPLYWAGFTLFAGTGSWWRQDEQLPHASTGEAAV